MKVGTLMGSKYFDWFIACFMAYFAYTRFETEQYGFATLFIVLCVLNVLTGFIKHKRSKEQANK